MKFDAWSDYLEKSIALNFKKDIQTLAYMSLNKEIIGKYLELNGKYWLIFNNPLSEKIRLDILKYYPAETRRYAELITKEDIDLWIKTRLIRG